MNDVTWLKHLDDEHGAEERVNVDLARLTGLSAADMQQESGPPQYIDLFLRELIIWNLGLNLNWI